MKISTSITILTAVFISLTSTLLAFNPEVPANGSSGSHILKNNSGRLYKSCDFSRFDRITGEFKKIKRITYEELPENNSRIHDIINLRPDGGIENEGKLVILGDHINRDSILTLWRNSFAGSNLQIVEVKHIYYDDFVSTPMEIETFNIENLMLLADSEAFIYNIYKDLTSHRKEEYSFGTLVDGSGDSTIYEYDISNRLTQRTSLSGIYNSEIGDIAWKPHRRERLEWDEEILYLVDIADLNPDGSIKELTSQIRDIEMGSSNPIHDWQNAPRYFQDKYVPGAVTLFKKVENNNIGNDRMTTTQVYDNLIGEYLNFEKKVEKGFLSEEYELNKYHFDGLDVKPYFQDQLAYSGTEEGDGWELKSASTRVQVSLSISFSLLTDNKSATIGDSILTLTTQIYDAGAGEWLYDFKQEFIFESITTGTDELRVNDKIKIFPNPSTGLLNIDFSSIEDLSQIDIVNSIGQTVSSEKMNNFSGNYMYNKDIYHLNKGIYFIKLYSDNKVISKKIILQ